MHHYITTYTEDGVRYAEAWLQLNLLGQCLCLWRVKTKI